MDKKFLRNVYCFPPTRGAALAVGFEALGALGTLAAGNFYFGVIIFGQGCQPTKS
jgi:hypothetical protein